MASGHEEGNSVFDFIYVDFQRISLLLSQFNNLGEMSQVSEFKGAGRGSEKGDSQELSGTVAVASGKTQFDSRILARHEQSISRTYDPRWMNAINFLDEAEGRSLLNREIETARIGELVLISGPLKITDFGALRDIWNKPSMVQAMKAGQTSNVSLNRHERRKTGKSSVKENREPDGIDLFLDLVDVLPHTVQSTIGNLPKGWGILRDEGLIGSATDFVLKFGGKIPGNWTMIGILEAFPDTIENPEDIVQTSALDQVGDALFSHLEPITRQLLGRPTIAYGLTPLLILREVG